MKSYASSDEVLEGLGEKVIEAFSKAMRRAQADLSDYRRTYPNWVADHSERGLANWISDRCWAHLLALADSLPSVTMVEKGVTREVGVDSRYRIRVKRHDFVGAIASYETPTFLDFVEQPQGQLEGTEEVRLVIGYEWITDSHDIGDAVISLRDGLDNVIWIEHLPVFAEEGVGSVVTPVQPTPPEPTLEVHSGFGRHSDLADGSEHDR